LPTGFRCQPNNTQTGEEKLSNFIEQFTSARRVSTPLVCVRTPDAASTISNIRKSLKTEEKTTPLVQWDAVHGLRGLNDKGTVEVSNMLSTTQQESAATVQLAIALGILETAKEDVICFAHNLQLFWGNDGVVVQGIWNLRDPYKANGNMLVALVPAGVDLPTELVNDVLILTEPLPTRGELRQIVKETFEFAKCKLPTEDVFNKAGDALIGIAAFPSEQATAMELNKETSTLNIHGLWDRKRSIVAATPGLSFYDGPETLKDAGGLTNIKTYLTRIMNGKRGANLLLRVDEIEKAFAGNGSDTSGVKTELLGNFLTWVEDRKVICLLFLGVPGAAKSHIVYCTGGEFKKPVVNFDIAGMQDSLVGNSGKNLRKAEAVVEAISDGQIILLATANSLRGLPPELISRFEKGGIFFFDTPDAEERKAILQLKIAKYELTDDQVKDVPSLEGWTGREIDSMCDKASNLSLTCGEAAKYIVPLSVSHAEMMQDLRESAHNRYLSASHEGKFQCKPVEIVHTPVVTQGRKMRDN
jgi:hypothetical protein